MKKKYCKKEKENKSKINSLASYAHMPLPGTVCFTAFTLPVGEAELEYSIGVAIALSRAAVGDVRAEPAGIVAAAGTSCPGIVASSSSSSDSSSSSSSSSPPSYTKCKLR